MTTSKQQLVETIIENLTVEARNRGIAFPYFYELRKMFNRMTEKEIRETWEKHIKS